jgi:hypothetical protein
MRIKKVLKIEADTDPLREALPALICADPRVSVGTSIDFAP